jgi:hypothetical protein
MDGSILDDRPFVRNRPARENAFMPRVSLSIGLAAAILALLGTQGRAQGIASLTDLARLSPPQLETLYDSSAPGTIPQGKVRGLPLMKPGSKLAVPLSRGGRVFWQGKIFHPSDSTAINRFFGVRMIQGEVGYGPSVRDGRPSIILDYGRTSHIYRPYRDEIREVSPGLYHGLMYDRDDLQRGPVQYFAFEAR